MSATPKDNNKTKPQEQVRLAGEKANADLETASTPAAEVDSVAAAGETGSSGSKTAEAQLLAAIRSGSSSAKKHAIGELYRATAPALFQRVLMPRLQDRALAEEALSATFQKVLSRLDTFEDRGASLAAWINTIGRNTAIDMLRKTGRERKGNDRLLAAFGVMASRGPESEVESYVAAKDERAWLRAAIEEVLAELNPRYARAIELRFFKGLERETCAAEMDVQLGTFDVLLLRSLRSFRKVWEANRD